MSDAPHGPTPIAFEALEQQFRLSPRGTYMTRDGAGVVRGAPRCDKKICFVATDKPFLVALLHRLSLRDDCIFVKYSIEPRDGMYLGRCFLSSEREAGLLCHEYKSHPKLMVTIQDDEFFKPFRSLPTA